MEPPKIPDNEAERLHALRALKILDTTHEERFDRVTRMAKRMFGVPISLVSLIDKNRQWFKSAQGLEVTETPREISFCAHAINHDGLFIIPNAVDDKRFCDNPLVTDDPNIRFYAGYPLKLRQGVNIGTLCLIDRVPREMDEEDCLLLQDLGAMIEQEIKSVQMATLDELTMVSNRRGFLLLADHTLKVCKRKKLKSAVLVFDLNKFKPINDAFGHHEGDYVLKTFAKALLESFRESDVVARWGGDEFVVFLTDSNTSDLEHILPRLKDKIVKVNEQSNKPYRIEYSCGVSHYNYDSPLSLEERIEEADYEMYKEKRMR
ncbi:diguanylate cyclase [Vibrio natriegens]|uniref:sensor domain-containing diguanylate cyclase n=1 Tax=Vibrio natriegens TaxID=691 RepID=UPI000803D9CA|nr:sensor domain-containing diguanylate cyclase [Vibrio natriegens]ANQ28610.1 diguanylate cyclase [Vibrio natriegens]